MIVPFCFFPLEKAKRAGRFFSGPAEMLSKTGQLKMELQQADIPLTPFEYVSISLFTSSFISGISAVLLFLGFLFSFGFVRSIGLGMLMGLVVFAGLFVYLKMYPKKLIRKKTRDIESNLLPALKHIVVQIKSGIPMYDALVSVSRGSFGKLSDEFQILIKNVDTGTSIESSLENLSVKTPSLYFRRAIWQISNGMKAGSDVGTVISEIVNNLSQQKIVVIRKYGSQLNPLTLVYMMLAIIMPALGVTFLFIFSSFTPLPISELTFYMILFALAMFQFFYMGIIKSRRPSI